MLMNKLEWIKVKIERLLKEGFLSIFLSNALAKVVAFLGGTILINVLTKDDYGTFTYVLNSINMLCILGDFGSANATMQFASENAKREDKRNAYISLGIRVTIASSFLSCLLIFFSPYFFPYTIDNAENLTRLLIFIPPIVSMNTLIIGVVRARLMNHRFALINIFSVIIHYLVIIPFAYFGGLVGSIIAQYFFDGSTLIFGIFLSFSLFKFVNYKKILSKGEIKSFFKFSFATQINTTIDSILISVDLFLIGLIISNTSVIASYKTASILPTAMAFLPTSIIIFLIPYFARNNQNMDWIRKNTKILITGGIVVYGMISLLSIIFAPLIITTIFGESYADSVLCFRILMIGFFFSATFKLPLNNIIYTMRRVRINIIATCISGLVNLALDPLLINYFGSVGAAITTCFVMVANSIFVIFYMKNLLKKS